MPSAPRTDRYSSVANVLHWTIAAAIGLQILLAWRMDDLKTPLGFALTQLHKSVGITVLLLSLVRLAWRLVRRPPPEPPGLKPWERALSLATHLAFYGIMIGMPLTGWIMVSASRTQIPTLLYGAVPWPHLPVADLAPAAKATWRTIGHEGHEWLAYGAYALILLHVAGALKHQLFDREMNILGRMAPGARPGRLLDPRLLLVGLGAVAVIAFAELVNPPTQAAPAASAREEAGHDEDGDHDAPAAASAPAPPAAQATAATPAPAAPAAAPAGPSRWSVGKGSSIGFATTWGGQAIEGRFPKWTSEIVFAPDALDRSHVRVVIALDAVSSGDAQRDQSLASADWFDTAQHPTAEFVASRFERTADDRFTAHGKLTLRGVSRPVDLPFRLKIDGDKATVSGVTTLDRTAFGVGQGEWQATDQIPAKVQVSLRLNATRK